MAQANVLFRDFFFCLSPTDTQIHVIPQQKLNLTGVAQCIILFDAKKLISTQESSAPLVYFRKSNALCCIDKKVEHQAHCLGISTVKSAKSKFIIFR